MWRIKVHNLCDYEALLKMIKSFGFLILCLSQYLMKEQNFIVVLSNVCSSS